MQSDMELVSVIITTCKREPEIVMRAIKSVQSQSYSNWELLVVDDSPESFEKRKAVENAILEVNDNRIKYIKQPSNFGAQVARNKGLSLANGEWINFLDDDDEFLPDKLEIQLQAAKLNNVLWVTGTSFLAFEKRNIRKKRKKDYFSGYVFDKLLENNFIPSITPLIHRSCFEKVGNFDETLESAQDYDMWLRISKEFPLFCVEKPGMVMHVHENARISSNPQKKLQGLCKILEKYDQDIKVRPRLHSWKIINLAKYYIIMGDYKNASEILKKANKTCHMCTLKNSVYFVYWRLKYSL